MTSPRATATPRRATPTAAKTADCTNLGTGEHYPCTQQEYDAINEADEPSHTFPTRAQCHGKSEPATLDLCNSLGYPYGMTLEEMRSYDAGAGSTCATGTQLYAYEHGCRVISRTAGSTTWSDGSVTRF